MQICLPALITLLLFSSISVSSARSTSCAKDSQCQVSNTICALCIQGKGPACTTPICVDGKCGQIGPCSLDLSGSCTDSSQCITNHVCLTCMQYRVPFCTQAICLNNQCAVIAPCSITVH